MTPAAVLSIMVQTQGVPQAAGQLNSLNSTAKKTGGGLGKVAKVAAVGLAGGMAAGAVAVKKFVDAASESQVSTTRMQTQLKALGVSYGKHADQIDKVIQKTSALSGLDDEDLQDAFTNIVRTTKNVTTALKDTGLAADLARAKNISLEAASKLVQKAEMGQVGALRRVGIESKVVTAAQDKVKASLAKWKAEHGKLTPEMTRHFDGLKAQAKASDLLATKTGAIGALQKTFSGQAAAYGKTAAGAQDRFKVAVENLQETLGQHLLPIATKVAGAVADFVNGMSTGEGAGGTFVATLKSIAGAFQSVWDWAQKNKTVLTDIGIVVGTLTVAYGVYRAGQLAAAAATTVWATAQAALNAVMTANPVALIAVALAALVAGLILAYKHSETFRNIVNGAFEAIKSVAVPVVEWLSKAIPDAWAWIKTATMNLWDWIGPYVKGVFEVIKTAVAVYFKAYWALIKGVWTTIKAVTTTLWDWFGPYIVAIWAALKTAVTIHFNAVKTVISGVWDAIKTVTKTAWDAFGALVIDPVKKVVSLVKAAFGDDGLLGWFKEHMEAFKTLGSGIVNALLDGIRGAASAIASVAGWLKDQVVGAVKKAFGIDSPSKVMAELGGHMASGLIKGIVGGDVMGFIKSHLGGVTGIAGNVLGGLGGKLAGLFGGGKGKGGGGSLQNWLTTALAITGQLTPGNLAALTKQALSESGGNPKAINLWDINAQQGHPSKGLLQTIDSTFNAYKMPGMGDIWNPIHNAVAAIRYMIARYGHIVGTGHGYAKGTPGAAAGWAWVGEKGPELVNFKGGETVLSNGDSKNAVRALASAARLHGYAGFAAWGKAHHLARKLGTGQWFNALASYAKSIGADAKQVQRDHGDMNRPGNWRSKWMKGDGYAKGTPGAAAALRGFASGTGPSKGLPAGGGVFTPTKMTALQQAIYLQSLKDFIKAQVPPVKGGGTPPAVVTASAVDAAAAGVSDSAQTLADSNTRLAEALEGVKSSIDAQTKFAKDVKSTSNYQLTKTLADLISGHIVGRGVAGRAFTPGSGVEYQY